MIRAYDKLGFFTILALQSHHFRLSNDWIHTCIGWYFLHWSHLWGKNRTWRRRRRAGRSIIRWWMSWCTSRWRCWGLCWWRLLSWRLSGWSWWTWLGPYVSFHLNDCRKFSRLFFSDDITQKQEVYLLDLYLMCLGWWVWRVWSVLASKKTNSLLMLSKHWYFPTR